MSEEQESTQVSQETLDSALDFGISQLSLSEKEKLSLALFPDTHTKSVEVLGKERILRPLTIKFSRRINELLKPYMSQLEKTAVPDSEEAKTGVPLESILSDLFKVMKALCEFYGSDWDDIKVAVADEELSLVEMEGVILQQSHLNTVNDFLLVPLRTLVRMLQLQEIRNVRLESLASMFTSLPLQNFGDAPLTNLSPDTQQDS